MISHKHRCIFVHVPKTGGQSVEHVFLALNGLEWKDRRPLLLGPNRRRWKGPPRLAHLTAEEYVGLGFVEQSTFDAYFTFAFVRNPWDRAVSEYVFRVGDGRISLEEFLTSHTRRRTGVLPRRSTDIQRHLLPQVDYLVDRDGRQLVDFVGRFESLQQDFDRVVVQLGLEPVTLPHENATKRRPYQEYFDETTVALVAELYRRDIEAFGYSYGA